MSVAAFYETLGLAPSAAPEVIRAAYKALALICHPDKTLHLTAEERASHAAKFNGIQAAYDVLGNPSLKAAYDAELARRSKKLKHSPPTSPSEALSTPSRKTTVKMTTPEEKTAMRAKARESINHLRIKRAERDAQDAELVTAGLKDMVHTWEQLLNDNRDDPAMRAHCQIRIHEYENKVFEREQQHREWLANLATAKIPPATPSHRPSFTAPSSSSPVHGNGRAAERKRADAERSAAAAAARSEARAIEKAQREAARQAHLDKKAASVRAEKDKLKAKADLIAQKDAERIAKARAKAGAAPRVTIGAFVVGDHAPAMTDKLHTTIRMQPPTTKKYAVCNGCDEGHDGFREWRKCNAQREPANERTD